MEAPAFSCKTNMETIEERRLELARKYRRELECLKARIDHLWSAVEQQTDEEIAQKAGLPPTPEIGVNPPVWLEGPLRATQDAVVAIQQLNLVRYKALEAAQRESDPPASAPIM